MSKLMIIGFVAAALSLPIAASAGHARHQGCSSASEMVACGKQGVKGNRAQFVAATTRPIGQRAFLWQLPH